MKTRLISIAGIDNKIEQVLRKRANVGTVKQLYDATRTDADRQALSEITGFSQASIAHWAAQAELFRIENMDMHTAYDLIDAGIYSVEKFRSLSATEAFERIKRANPYASVTTMGLYNLQHCDVREAAAFECETMEREMVAVESSVPSAYSDLSSMISELGKGIAQAQLALDRSSIDIQNQILEDDKLYNMGLQATWYVMPEVEFTMKMDYAVAEERTVSGKVLSTKLCAAPSNATFSNLFKTSKQQESTLKLRFVPIPAADRITERHFMPNLMSARTYAGIEELLEDRGITKYTILPEEAEDWGGEAIRVESQSPAPGTLLKLGVVPEIKIRRK